MSSPKCTPCSIHDRVWADAAWHAQVTCDYGHVTDLYACGGCKPGLERDVATCGLINRESRCPALTSYPCFTAL